MSIQDILKPRHRVQDLIEAEKARQLEKVPIPLTIGGVDTVIQFTELRGNDWSEVARWAPRPNHLDDARLGANIDRVIEDYPVESIAIDEQNPTTSEWSEFVKLFPAGVRADIVAAIFWLHLVEHKEGDADD